MRAWLINLIASLQGYLHGIFAGVYSADNVPRNIVKYPTAFIVNTQSSSQNGAHWIAIYICKGKSLEIFDSLGCNFNRYDLKLRDYITEYSCGYVRSLRSYQPEDSINLPCYALYYCDLRCRGLSKEDITRTFRMKDLKFNDLLVTSYVRDCMSIFE